MKTYSITIPDNKEKVFIEWMKNLAFVKRIEEQTSDIDIPEEHQKMIRQRIESTPAKDMLDWDQVKDNFRL